MAWVLVPALCLLSGAGAQDWNVTLGPGPLAGWVGSCVTIPCSFSLPRNWTVGAVSWTRDGKQTVYHSDGTRIHPAFVGRVRYLGDQQGNCSLRVAGLRPRHQGTYRFRFEAEQGGKKDSWSSKSGQRLSVSAHQCQPSLGSRTELGPALICSVGATCSQRPSWYGPDGPRLSPDQTPGGDRATELRISPSGLGPGAVLHCRVDGTWDECDSEPPPGTGTPTVEVSRPAGRAALREGDGFTLRCQASGPQLGARYIWSRGAVWLPGAGQELRVDNAAVSDGGSYACGVWVSGPGWGQLSLSARESVEVQHAPQGVHVTAAPGTSLREGDSVTLRCNYSSSLPAPTSYAWYRGSQRLEGSRQELVLENITAEQAGEYRCQVTNGIGQSPSPPITITVQWVHVTAAPGTHLREGDSVTLRCNHSSSLTAPPSYAWYRGSQSLNGSQQELVLENITAEQAGEYRCQVTNGIGQSPSQSPPITITVQWVRVTAAPGTRLREGESVTLRCNHSSSLPAPTSYAWYRGSQSLNGSQQELVLENITAEQAGEYRCQVANGIGQSPSPPITITVQWVRVTAAPGTSLREGDSVTLRCNHSSSLPAPSSYTWYRGSQSLNGSRQELVLENITAEQAGEYRCQVTNGIGQSQSPPITITVQCAPKDVNVMATPKTGLCAGEAVNLTCHFNSSLLTNVTWYRDNVRLNESQPVLAYERVTGSHTGKYRCEVQNQGGTAHSAPVTISVMVLFCIWEHIYIIGPTAAAALLLLMGLVSIIVWSKKRSKHKGAHSNLLQSGPGEIPLAECIYENTQSHGMGKPAGLAPPGPPSVPAKVCLGSPSDTEPSHIYSQPRVLGTVPQDDPDEVQYSVIQLQRPTQRVDLDADLACEYAAIKR
ncbi:B-cell receptor CD22-like isoform X1 [Pelodiscus sinensis]|uniref:B-cell receptor CD22-like isoform X1 n=1 Tax=Pelodiscus sinensis TaxID=13735 RepID=UPI003F6D9BDE